MVADACARANYENVAAFCDFAKNLIPLLEAGDNAAIREFVEVRAFATRIPSFVDQQGKGIEARSILTQIDHMKKKYAGYREAYDHLSDIVHPNGLGAVVHFVSIDPATRVATFPDTGKNPNWALASLIASGFMLAHMDVAISDIEQCLAKLKDDPFGA